jgi:RNA polymerase sigma factor (sigma-70 family)
MGPDEIKKTESVEAAVNRYAGPLIRYAMIITGDLETARDVVQDTFVKLWAEKPGAVDSRLAPWLFTVCRNRALDVLRKQRRLNPLSEAVIEGHPSDEPTPVAQAELRETAGHVLCLLARLPNNQQEVVRLKFQNGLTYQEISEVTGLSVSHVGVLLHTALKTIRRQLQPDGGPQPISTGGPHDKR